MPASRSRTWVSNGLLLAVSLTVSCGAGEIYLRWFRPQPLEAAIEWPDGTIRHRPDFSFRYTRADFSNIVSYNSIGMRGPDVAARKTPGVPRVLLMGDSYVEGKHVADDEVLTAVMRRLSAEEGRPLEVINLGVAGYGQGRELYLWDELGRELDPDLVILCVYVNDLRNNLEREFWEMRDGLLVETKRPDPPGRRLAYPVRKFLAAHSHLYVLFLLAKEQHWSREMDLETEVARDFFVWTGTEEAESGWRLTLALLEEFDRRVRESGAEFVVVAIPSKHQVDPALWAQYAALAGADPGAFDRGAYQQRLREWSRRTGVRLIDLFDEFVARNVDNSFYYTIDGHWNPSGHALAAELILEGLGDQGLIASARD